VSDGRPYPLTGLPPALVDVLNGAPVEDKVLVELAVGWAGLGDAEARLAEVLRVFLVTWDPLEHQASRPVAVATVNAGPPASRSSSTSPSGT